MCDGTPTRDHLNAIICVVRFASVPHDNNTLLALFSKASSHKMRQLALRSASKQSLSVLASTLAVDLDSVSVLRIASGMPTVADRIAQTVVARWLVEKVEGIFHPDSYAYRPNKSALDAVGKARERCWRHSWVIDLDIRAFFDSLDWELLMKAVSVHVKEAWMLLYIKRWLMDPAIGSDGVEQSRSSGTPQGGVVSLVLANLFPHYALDAWMKRTYPEVPFERYADDSAPRRRGEDPEMET